MFWEYILLIILRLKSMSHKKHVYERVNYVYASFYYGLWIDVIYEDSYRIEVSCVF